MHSHEQSSMRPVSITHIAIPQDPNALNVQRLPSGAYLVDYLARAGAGQVTGMGATPRQAILDARANARRQARA